MRETTFPYFIKVPKIINSVIKITIFQRDFKIVFSRPLFIIIFRLKMVFLVTDSILREKAMFGSVKEDVLSRTSLLLFNRMTRN